MFSSLLYYCFILHFLEAAIFTYTFGAQVFSIFLFLCLICISWLGRFIYLPRRE